MNEQTKALRTIEGRVVSNKMAKTVTVLLERQVPHPLYGKIVRRSTKVHAHDEDGQCKEGDVVRVKVLEVDRQGRVRLSMRNVDAA